METILRIALKLQVDRANFQGAVADTNVSG